MAVDMLMKVEGPPIKGETKNKGSKTVSQDGIDVLSWSWGVSNSGTTHMGSGSGAGRANFQDLSIVTWYEKSTNEFLKSAASGTHHEKITLVNMKAGDKPLEYIILTLENCIITSISTGGSGGEDRLTVSFSINFEKFDIKYVEQDEKGGVKSEVPFKYDIGAQEKT